jgi:hypothetical protein
MPKRKPEDPRTVPSKLQTLLSKATEKAAGGPPRRPPAEHPPVVLEAAELATIAAMIGLGELARQIAERQTRIKARARLILFQAFTAAFWAGKKKPPNPRIVVLGAQGEPDHDTLYQLRDQFALGRFEGRQEIIEALAAPTSTDAGVAEDAPLSRTQAIKLVGAEIKTDPALRLRYTLTELVEGHTEEDAAGTARFVPASPAEKAIAAKLLAFLLAESRTKRGPVRNVTVPGLTEAERELLLIKDPRLQFNDPAAFMARACSYVTNLAQLRRLLGTFRPTQVFSSSHFALGATERQRSRRLLELAGTVLDPPED